MKRLKNITITPEFVNQVLIVLLTFSAIVGNSIGFGVRVCGVTLTLYRVAIPLIALAFLWKRIRTKKIKQFFENKVYVAGLAIMLFWLVYGAVLLFASPYAPLREGMKELLNIGLGLILMYSFIEACTKKKHIILCMNVIKYIIIILVVIGFVELLCGVHFSTSKYFVENAQLLGWDAIVAGLKMDTLFPVTTIFYGVNDFSVFLAIFIPVLFSKNKKKIAQYVLIGIVIFFVSVNDANICLLALLLVLFVAFIISKFNIQIGIIEALVLLIQLWWTKIISTGLLKIKKIFGFFIKDVEISNAIIESEKIEYNLSTSEAIVSQVSSASGKTGSLYQRILLTIDAFNMWVSSHFLGMGPASYSEYIQQNGGKSKYINPHNWWMEILSQYGIFVFVSYVGYILYIAIKCILLYRREKDMVILKYICILVLYVICSIAPSSFIAYSYQWLIVAMGMVIVSGVTSCETE